MTSQSKSVKAACLCGSHEEWLSLPTNALPLRFWFCHCDSCRSTSGTLGTTAVQIPAGCRPSQSTLESLQVHKFSEKVDVYFCSTCGTHMFWRYPKPSEHHASAFTWFAATGALEQAEGIFELQGHFNLDDTKDGGVSDWMTQLSGKEVERRATTKDSENLPIGWQSAASREATKVDPANRYHAHCKCKGVGFWIARPSLRSTQASSPWPDVLVPYNSGPHHLPENETWWLRANKQRFLGGVCACNSCRLATGYEFVQWAFVPTVDITLDAEGRTPFSTDFGSLKRYRSSADATRYFCKDCGATIFYEGHERPALFDVAVGLIEAPEGARAESLLEWRTERLSFREDAILRAESLVKCLEAGMKAYNEHGAGRKGPAEEVRRVIDTER